MDAYALCHISRRRLQQFVECGACLLKLPLLHRAQRALVVLHLLLARRVDSGLHFRRNCLWGSTSQGRGVLLYIAHKLGISFGCLHPKLARRRASIRGTPTVGWLYPLASVEST